METRQQASVLDILKALADESRLALLRMVNEDEQTVGDLAQKINLGEPTVSHHLSKLREVGLVSLRMAGNQRFYRVNETGLARFKRLVAEIEQMPPEPEPSDTDGSWIAALGWEPWDQQVLREHTSRKDAAPHPQQAEVAAGRSALAGDPVRTGAVIQRTRGEHDPQDGLRGGFCQPAERPGGPGLPAAGAGRGKYWLAPTDADTAN